MPNRLSAYCEALCSVAGRTTHYYVCEACNKLCDTTPTSRTHFGPRGEENLDA